MGGIRQKISGIQIEVSFLLGLQLIGSVKTGLK
jgi:hypothetical protein